MTNARKKKDKAPKMSKMRMKKNKTSYLSKLNPARFQQDWMRNYDKTYAVGQRMKDGMQFTKKKCVRCHCRLTHYEYDQIGVVCTDCY